MSGCYKCAFPPPFVWVVHSVSGLNWKETPPWFLARILRQPAIFLIFLTATVNQTTRRPKAPALSLQLDSAQTTHTVSWHAVDTRGILLSWGSFIISFTPHLVIYLPPPTPGVQSLPKPVLIGSASSSRLHHYLSATFHLRHHFIQAGQAWGSPYKALQPVSTFLQHNTSNLTVYILPDHDGEEEQMLSNVNDHKLPHVEPIIVCGSTFSPKTSPGEHTTVENYT